MTKEEAIQAMKAGKKVTHDYFGANEWMTMQDGKLMTEEGYTHPWHEFWSYRTGSSWNSGYSIWTG